MLSLYVCPCSGYGCADCASLVLMGILGCLCPGYGPVFFWFPVPGLWACGIYGWFAGYAVTLSMGFGLGGMFRADTPSLCF